MCSSSVTNQVGLDFLGLSEDHISRPDYLSYVLTRLAIYVQYTGWGKKKLPSLIKHSSNAKIANTMK